MSNYEQSAKAIESDYRYAPVGMAVGSFWGGSLVAGVTIFLMSTGIAKGFVPTTIVDNQRVLFTKDYIGLWDGIAVAAILLVMSILYGVAARGVVAKKKDIAGLWKGILVIPVLTFFITVGIIAVRH